MLEVTTTTGCELLRNAVWSRFIVDKLGNLTEVLKSELRLQSLTKLLETLQEAESSKNHAQKKKKASSKQDHTKLVSKLISANQSLVPKDSVGSDTVSADESLAEVYKSFDNATLLTLEHQIIPAPALDPMFRGKLDPKPTWNKSNAEQKKNYVTAFGDLVKIRLLPQMRIQYLDVPARAMRLDRDYPHMGFSSPEGLLGDLICADGSNRNHVCVQILEPRLVAVSILRPGVPFVCPTKMERQIFYKGNCVFCCSEEREEGNHQADDFMDFHVLMERTHELLFRSNGIFYLLKLTSRKVVLQMEDKHPPEEEPEEIEELCHELQKYEQEYFYHDYVEPNPTDYGYEEGESH